MPEPLADATVAALIVALAKRTPTPGGGAAAAVAAALGCAAGAMAARYTTGAKWAEASADAQALATELDRAASECLAAADADAAAYAAVRAARASGDAAALRRAEAAAAAVPATLLSGCVRQAQALDKFLPRCNPQLASDVKVALHLLIAAGRAAHETLEVNRPDDKQLADAAQALVKLALVDPVKRRQ